MTSQNIWERRIIAGLLSSLQAGPAVISGLSTEGEDGDLVFVHEPLSDAEVQRIDRALDTVRRRLQRRYDTLGGSRGAGGESDEDEALPDEDDEETPEQQEAAEPADTEEGEQVPVQEEESSQSAVPPAEQPAGVDPRALAFLNG